MTQPGTQVPRVPCPPCLPQPAPTTPELLALTADGAARSSTAPAALLGATSTGDITVDQQDDEQVDEDDARTAPDTTPDTAP